MTAAPPWKFLLSPPEVGELEREFLLGAFDSNWIAPAGPDLEGLEADLAELTGAPHVVALSSGTEALFLALEAVGVRPGDDVVVPSLTFAASAFAVSQCGARPCFVDASRHDWHLDPDLLSGDLERRARAGDLPAAVISVDLYGSVADGRRLAELCGRFGVPLVADSAEAVGAYRDGEHAGRSATVGVLSFNGNKIVTTGGGGAIFSDDAAIVERARYLGTQAREPVPWYEHTEVGRNARLSNISAAIGRGQLRTLADRIVGRRRVRKGYEDRLSGEAISFQPIPDGCVPNHWLTTITVDSGMAERDRLLDALRRAGVEARHGFKPMHLQPVYRDHPMLAGAVSDDLFARSLSLPSGSRLTDDDLDVICDVIVGARA